MSSSYIFQNSLACFVNHLGTAGDADMSFSFEEEEELEEPEFSFRLVLLLLAAEPSLLTLLVSV